MRNRHWIRWLPEPVRNKLSGRTNLQAILANSGWLIFDKIIRTFLGLFIGVWLARYLGPNELGELAYALACIAIFQAAATLGLDTIIVRDVSQNKMHASQILGTCFLLRLTFGIICWITAITSMGYINGWSDRSVWITAIAGGSLIFQAADTIDLWFQSQSKSRYTVSAKLSAYIISNGIKCILIINEAPLLAFAALIALESLLAAIALSITYIKFPCENRWHSTAVTAKQLIKESWPLLSSSICIMLYIRIDQIMIKEILGEKELGVYSAVLTFSTVWTAIPMIVSVSLSPHIAKIKKNTPDKYNEAISDIFIVFAMIGWFSSCITLIASTYVVPTLLGEKYITGISALAVHAFTNIFICMGVAQSLWIINEKKTKLSIYKTVSGLAVCVSCNALLIPKIGILGAAISAVLANLTAAIASNFIFAPEITKQQIFGMFFMNTNRRDAR